MHQSDWKNTEGQPPGEPAALREPFRLAVFALPENREAVLETLTGTLKFSTLDAKIRLSHLPGILPETWERDVAEVAAHRLSAVGGQALAVHDRDVPCLDRARMLHHVCCRENGFAIIGISGRIEEIIPWSKFSLVSIGVVPLAENLRETDWKGGAIHAAPVAPSAPLKTRHFGPELWLTTENPFRAFHIEHDAMNYECLGERKSTSATANFSEFLAELLAHMPEVFLTHSARAFVEHSSADECRFESQEAHRSYVTAQVLLMRQIRSAIGPHSSEIPAPSRVEISEPAADRDERFQAALQQQAHFKLQQNIHDLRAWWHDVCELGEPRLGELKLRVAELRSCAEEHFAFEEAGGYMRRVLDVAPRLQESAERLHREHQAILDELTALAASLEKTERLRPSCRELEEVLRHLEHHEHAENALVQEAFEFDIGAGD